MYTIKTLVFNQLDFCIQFFALIWKGCSWEGTTTLWSRNPGLGNQQPGSGWVGWSRHLSGLFSHPDM